MRALPAKEAPSFISVAIETRAWPRLNGVAFPPVAMRREFRTVTAAGAAVLDHQDPVAAAPDRRVPVAAAHNDFATSHISSGAGCTRWDRSFSPFAWPSWHRKVLPMRRARTPVLQHSGLAARDIVLAARSPAAVPAADSLSGVAADRRRVPGQAAVDRNRGDKAHIRGHRVHWDSRRIPKAKRPIPRAREKQTNDSLRCPHQRRMPIRLAV
jgi:hypothetical protein